MVKRAIPKSAILDALRATRGNVTLAALKLGITRRAVLKRLTREEIDEIRNDADLWRVDVAESKLDEKLLAGDSWTIRFVLERKGKSRGWGELERSIALSGAVRVESQHSMLDVLAVMREFQRTMVESGTDWSDLEQLASENESRDD